MISLGEEKDLLRYGTLNSFDDIHAPSICTLSCCVNNLVTCTLPDIDIPPACQGR